MLPTIERAYQVEPSIRVTASGTVLSDNKATLLAIVDGLLGMSTNPMTCAGSSNGVAANMSGTNTWTDGAALLWSGLGAQSWIVLEDPSGFQILIALNTTSADGHLASVYLSASGGFSGGTTTERPAATDAAQLVGAGAWGGVTTSVADVVIHLIHESTGTSGGLSVIIMSAGDPIGFWHVSAVKDAIGIVGAYDGWENPVFGLVTSGADCMSLEALNQTAAARAYVTDGATLVDLASLYLTCEGYGDPGVTLAQAAFSDDQTGEFSLSPIGLFSTTSGVRGRKGSVYDLWFGQSVNQDGDSYPSDGSRQLVQFGGLVFPWSAAAPDIV